MARADKNYRGPCFYCLNVFKWIPVLFITLIILWSYYAYVHQLCLLTVESNTQRVLYLIFYHFFFILLCWTYMQSIFSETGRVPDSFKLEDCQCDMVSGAENSEALGEVLSRISSHLPLVNVNANGSVRFCDKCKVIKPDRAHHCSVCGECVLKMDHHCPWINNCVGFTNYKFFIQFLGYALTYCIYVAATTLPYFVRFWNGELAGAARFHLLFLFFVALMFGISLISLFGYHCYLVSENRTTLEAFRAPVFRRLGADKKGFHVGRRRNIEEVFGTNVLLWFVPVKTSLGDGVTFPNRHMV